MGFRVRAVNERIIANAFIQFQITTHLINTPICQRPQKLNFSDSWSERGPPTRKRGVNPLVTPLKGVFAMAVDTPNKLAELKFPEGSAKLGWLSALKQSALSWKFIVPVT